MKEDSLYVKVRQFFQPYYRPRKKSQKHKRSDQTEMTIAEEGSERSVVDSSGFRTQDTTLCKVLNYPKPLTYAYKFNNKPKPRHVWCYHDSERHEVFGCFAPGDGYRCKERDGAARAQMKPSIYPRQNKPFDRTHLIPIGYHGSDSDPRLLIGWDSEANRGPFMEFEQKQKARNVPIYWLTCVHKTHSGAKWTYLIFDARNMRLLDGLEDTMICPFVWNE